jgi:hypothetical protein
MRLFWKEQTKSIPLDIFTARFKQVECPEKYVPSGTADYGKVQQSCDARGFIIIKILEKN